MSAVRTIPAARRAPRGLAAVALCLAAPQELAVGGSDEPPPPGAVRIEVEAPREAWYEGETIALRLRVAVDRDFLERRMLQLFQQRLDVPVVVQAPWLDGAPCLEALPADGAPAGEASASLALGDAVARGALERRELDGRAFAVVALERRFVATCPGELVLAAPTARFAYGSGFVEDPFAGRVPARRGEATARGEPLALWVRPLPEEGRPPEFTGAIGRFRVEAEARPRELALGESLQLALRIEGEGEPARFEPPRLRRLPGFRVLGVLDELDARGRTLTYDLAPESALVEAVPSLPFVSFDPSPPPGYRTVWTRPIPIEVRPAAAAERPPAEAAEREPPPESGPPAGRSRRLLLGLAVVVTAAAAALVLLRRRRRAG